MSTSNAAPVRLPTISNGSSAVVTLPAASGSATANITLQATLPSGVVAPQIKKVDAIGGTVTGLDYVAISVSSSVAITSTPTFAFTLAAPPPSGSTTYIAVYDSNNAKAGWNILLGPGSVNGNNVSFAPQTLVPPLTLQAKDVYIFALVATGAPVTPAPPTIAPSTSASYTGTKTVNYAYGYDFDYPNPAPSATAPGATLTYNVSANVSVGASPFPGTSSATLLDEHIAETDAGSVQSSSFATDSWVSLAAANSSYNELLYGQTVQQPSSANLPVITTLYTAPQIVDELPETNGASWTNSPQSSVAYAYASGDNGTRTVASDGSYADTEQMGPVAGGATATLTENADGSGSIVGPYFGGGFIDSVAFSAPQPSATPSLTVTIAYSALAQQYYGLPATRVIADNVWYPYTAGSAPAFYKETDTVQTGATLPSGCSASPYAAVNDVHRSIVSLDTVIGYVEDTEMDSYNAYGFPVCLVTHDTLGFAYDQQGNTPFFILIGKQPDLETVTTDETLVIQNAPAYTSGSTSMSAKAQAANTHAFVAALQGHVLNSLARARAAHTRSFLEALRQARFQGGRK